MSLLPPKNIMKSKYEILWVKHDDILGQDFFPWRGGGGNMEHLYTCP